MTAENGWASYHIFYHGDRNLVLRHLVRPAAATLLADGHVDRFFFIRYPLGGPHVRLRLRVIPGREEAVTAGLTGGAVAFFRRWPSTETMPEEEVRQGNRAILNGDPSEHDDSVYPDNTLRRFPCRFEVERYGGADLLAHSLDFFTLSSVQALHFLDAHGEEPQARQLATVFRLLAGQACGLAADRDELIALLEYCLPVWGVPLAPFVERGEQVFARDPQPFLRLLGEAVESASDPAPAPDAEAARRLAWEIRGAPRGTRRRIATSQMHMTANRIGLRNKEEVYLCRLMSLAARELAAADPDRWDGLGALLAARATEPPAGGLPALLAPALKTLAPGLPGAGDA